MLVRRNDGVTFTEEPIHCDGSNVLIRAQRRCIIPFSTFRAEPFNIAWGGSIFARVRATNIMGDSQLSPAGNGGVITRVPDPPTGLLSDSAISNAVVIGLIWVAPIENGGVEILDYRIWYDQGLGSDDYWEVLDYGIK